MANLTKEYFDKKLTSLTTKKDLEGFSTKKDLITLKQDLKDSLASKDEVENLAGMIARRFDEVERKLDVKEEVEKLKTQMKQVREALNL